MKHDWYSPPPLLRVVSAISAKGGAGKSTSIMALASVFADAGARVLLVDTDQNTPMTNWKSESEDKGLWDEKMSVAVVDDAESMGNLLSESAENGTHDVALIDPRGGLSEFAAYVAVISDVVVVPSQPNKIDGDAAVKTFKFLVSLKESQDTAFKARLLLTRMPSEGALRAAQKVFVEAFRESFPIFSTLMRERDAYYSSTERGPLHRVHAALLDSGIGGRFNAGNYMNALGEASELGEEIWRLMDED